MRKNKTNDWIAYPAILLFGGFIWSVTDVSSREELFAFVHRHVDATSVIVTLVILAGVYSLFNLVFHIIRFRAE